ncbi:MAG: glycosyltransferase family 2 protein [Armatimonadota bacterium]|nr:glycosyltransferase family 2 protein [bacterium]MCS7309856.1 glycosyltransferase family 2 protein [Armatimonadota bacterium]MDW8290702.1 glycosyltransferase family 2 protein [Armatimonadota bacterium]
MSRVFAVVPAHNEAQQVANTVRSLLTLPAEVVVVADACSDDTAERAREAGATVLTRRGRGDKARALARGMRWLQEQHPADDDVVLLIDADVGDTAREAVRLVQPVRACEAELAIGVLPPAGRRGGFGLVARFAQWVLRLQTGRCFRAPLSGQRALRWGVLCRLHALAEGFGVEVGMTADLVRLGARVQEVEVEMTHRYTGRSWRGFLHRARQGWHVLLASVGRRPVQLWTGE